MYVYILQLYFCHFPSQGYVGVFADDAFALSSQMFVCCICALID